MAAVIRVEESRRGEVKRVREPRSVAAPGFAHTISWPSVAGATVAEVQEASVFLSPAVATETQQDVSFSNSNGFVVNIPAKKRVKSLTLTGLKLTGGQEITGDGNLSEMRLAVSFPPAQGGGWDSPRFSVPAVASEKMVPATLTGATFSNRVLRFNDSVPAAKVRVSLVTGSEPRNFDVQSAEVSKIHLVTETSAHNIKLVGPDGASLWQVPEYDPDAPSTEVDIRTALEFALDAKAKAGEPVEATFTVSADAPAEAIVSFGRVTGALLRVHEGVLRADLKGDPVRLDLGTIPLANETPRSVTGDLTITYAGIRILETVSDEPLAPDAAVTGVIAGANGMLKVFAPQALDGITPARIGIIGRAPEECELSLEFVSVNGGIAVSPVGPPAVITLTPDNEILTRWVDVPAGVALNGPLGLRVRANRGRFFWVTREQPLARIAIADPDPGGRPLFLGTSRLKDIVETNSHEPGFSFTAADFRNVAPLLRSDLFLTVDISDLTLRYPR
ncbi:MAG TPA: hypothetical protein VFZ22_09965 [Pyrinomonadaceae bacterium]|nr:hypothetical protein [Pyrinomonadaceae bacterium]